MGRIAFLNNEGNNDTEFKVSMSDGVKKIKELEDSILRDKMFIDVLYSRKNMFDNAFFRDLITDANKERQKKLKEMIELKDQLGVI